MSGETYGPRTRAWAALKRRTGALARKPITVLFDENPGRADVFAVEAEGLWLDLSRQRLDAPALALLLELAEQTCVPDWIERMFSGERINNTEDRAALHTALRRPADRPVASGGENVMLQVEAQRTKMRALADALHDRSLTGYTGRPITDIVNIGIGGSDLGVVMAVEALDAYRMPGLGVHFVSNVDGVQLARVLRSVDPETTLFVVCSKTFADAGDTDQCPGGPRMGCRFGADRRRWRRSSWRYPQIMRRWMNSAWRRSAVWSCGIG